MSTFKVICGDKTTEYTGFKRFNPETPLGAGVVCVWFDGEPELWQVDNGGGMNELTRYYRQQYDRHIRGGLAALADNKRPPVQVLRVVADF